MPGWKEDISKINNLDELPKELFDYIADDNTIFDTETLEQVAQEGQLMAYKHEGFWQCMDTYRDYEYLNNLWNTHKPGWKCW